MIRSRRFWFVLPCVFALLLLSAWQVSAKAPSNSLLPLYQQRVAMVLMDQKCGQLTFFEHLSLLAYAAQVRGTMLRNGVPDQAIRQRRQDALGWVRANRCGAEAASSEFVRVRAAYAALSSSATIELPASERIWTVAPAGTLGWRAWQETDEVEGAIKAGFIYNNGDVRFAVQVPFTDVSRLTVYLRNLDRLARPRQAQGLSPPVRRGTTQHQAAERRPPIALPAISAESEPIIPSGVMMVFSVDDTRRIARLDARDAFELVTADRHGNENAWVIEAGDITSAYALSVLP